MAKLIAFMVSLLMLGVAHAQIADAPIPKSNYIGIILFLVLVFVSSGYFLWKIMKQKKDDKE